MKIVEPTEEEFLDIDESNIDIIMDIDEEDNGFLYIVGGNDVDLLRLSLEDPFYTE